MASVFKRSYAFYNRQYQARPILTICTTNAILAGISDSLTQKYLAPAEPAAKHAAQSLKQRTREEVEELGQDVEQSWHVKKQEGAEAIDNLKDKAQTKAENATESIKGAAQSAKDSAADKIKGGVEGTRESVKDSVKNMKDKGAAYAKGSANYIKESVDEVKDHAKTMGEQTVKEVKERGMEGAKDMAEGYKKIGSEMVEIGKQKVKDHMPDGHTAQSVKDKGAQYAKDTAQSAKDYAESVKDRGVAHAKDAAQSIKGSAESAKDRGMAHAKDSAQSIRDSAESAKDSAEGHARGVVQSVKDSAKDMKDKGVSYAKGSANYIKESVDEVKDHAKTMGEQTVKEVKERGMEGAKDMAEGYKKIGSEMVEIGKQKVKDNMPDTGAMTMQSSGTPPLDYSRMGRFMLYNFSVAPLIHTWYTFLDRRFPLLSNSNPAVNSQVVSKMPPPAQTSRMVQAMTPALKRVVADQTLFAPVGLALLFSGLTVLEGGGVPEIKEKLNNTYIDALKANYMVWPLVQLVNFSVMPLNLRLPFVSAVGIAWNAYLSLTNAKGRQATPPPDMDDLAASS
ncbi:hypothetical protein EDD11_008652 [Mortierella claussenii]|nr:hypothetical protein EDD11_008652 [Mortierella claussenii]